MKYTVKLSKFAQQIQRGEVSVQNPKNLLILERVLPLIVLCILKASVASKEEDFPGRGNIIELLEKERWEKASKKLTRISFFIDTFGGEESPGYDLTVRVHRGSEECLFFQLFYSGGGYKGLWLHGFDDGTNF